MNQKKSIWIFTLFSITLLLLSLSSCSSQETTFRDETISPENKAEILSKANTELTVEEARLLGLYLERSYPQLAENDLPAGRTLNQMIEDERVVESTSPAQVAAIETDLEPKAASADVSPPKAEIAPPAKPETRTPTPPKPDPARETAAQNSAPARQTAAQAPTPAPVVADTSGPDRETYLTENADQASPAEIIPEAVGAENPLPILVEVESGADIQVRLVEALGTKTAVTGDRFELQLAEDLVVENQVIAPRGSRARGRVLNSQSAGKVKGVATITLTLTDLYIGEEQFPLQAETLTYEAEKTTGKDAAKVGVASGIGAILGAIIGGKKGAVIGAGVGAGAGTTTVLATRGDELEFPVEQMFRFRLTEGFSVEVLQD
jgi:hypothetical protein